MSYEVIKIIKGNPYRYLVHSERDGDRVRQVFDAYLGRADGGGRVRREKTIVQKESPIELAIDKIEVQPIREPELVAEEPIIIEKPQTEQIVAEIPVEIVESQPIIKEEMEKPAKKQYEPITKSIEGIGGVDAGIADDLEKLNKAGFKTIQSHSGIMKDHPENPEYPYSKRTGGRDTGYIAFMKADLTPEKVERIRNVASKFGFDVEDSETFFQPSIVIRSSKSKTGTSAEERIKQANQESGLEKAHIKEPDYLTKWEARDNIEKKLLEESGGYLLDTDEKAEKAFNDFTQELTSISSTPDKPIIEVPENIKEKTTKPIRIIQSPRGKRDAIIQSLKNIPDDTIIKFYHGTSKENADKIISSGKLLPDDLQSIGLSASYDVALNYANMKAGNNGVVLEVSVKKSELGLPDTTINSKEFIATDKQLKGEDSLRYFRPETGGTGEDAILVSDLFKKGNWQLPLESAKVTGRTIEESEKVISEPISKIEPEKTTEQTIDITKPYYWGGKSFDKSKSGTFLSNDPEYAKKFASQTEGDVHEIKLGKQPRVYPETLWWQDYQNMFNKEQFLKGYDAVRIIEPNLQGESLLVLNPDIISEAKSISKIEQPSEPISISKKEPQITRKGKTFGSGFDAISARQLSDGKYQVTPSYNQQTKGVERQTFDTEDEALKYITSQTEDKPEIIKPEDKPVIEKEIPKQPISRTAGFGEISQYINRPKAENFRLNIMQFPSGIWGYVGTIPEPLTEDNPKSLVPDAKQSKHFQTKDEAIAAAKAIGYEEGKLYSIKTGEEVIEPTKPIIKTDKPQKETKKRSKKTRAKESWQLNADDYDKLYPEAGLITSGLKVKSGEVPNMTSIESSIDNPTIVSGIREVPMSAFENQELPKFYSPEEEARTLKLVDDIKQSGEITPLIVAYDSKGAYILEGGHRFDALKLLGVKSFPAKVVIDEDSLYESVKQAVSEGKPIPPEVLKDYPDLQKQIPTMQEVIAEYKPIGSTSKITEEPILDIGGYEQTLSAPVRAKAIEQMNTQKMINGKGQTRKEYVENAIANGATVEIREGKKAIVKPDGTYMRQSEITKTAIDYAEYLIDKNKQQPIPETVEPMVKPDSSPKQPAKLAPMEDNFLKPLSYYTPEFYRETNIDGLAELSPNVFGYLEGKDLFVSNTPNLALGQGKNKGVLIKFKAEGLQGQVNTSKPSWKFAYDNGEAEFVVKHTQEGVLKNNIESITISPEAKGDRLKTMQANNWLKTWDKTPNADGSITYTPPTQPLPQSEPRETKHITKIESTINIPPNMPISYVEAKKRPDGKWQLYFTGTRNEVFPNELFDSQSDAKMAFKVAKARLAGKPEPTVKKVESLTKPEDIPIYKEDSEPPKEQTNWQKAQSEVSDRIQEIEDEWTTSGNTQEQQTRMDNVINEIATKYNVPVSILRKNTLWEQVITPEARNTEPLTDEQIKSMVSEVSIKHEPTKDTTIKPVVNDNPELWEMTLQQSISKWEPLGGFGYRGNQTRKQFVNEYLDIIKRSIREGKPVPQNVLDEYEQLKPKKRTKRETTLTNATIPSEPTIKPSVSKEFIEYYGTPEFYTPETKLTANFTNLIEQQYDSTIKDKVRNIHIGKVKDKEAWADGFMLEIKPVPEKLKGVKGYTEKATDSEGKPRDFTNLVPDYGLDGIEVKPILKTITEKATSSNPSKVFLANTELVRGTEQKYITLQPKYVEYFLKNYPDAKFIMKNKSSPVIVKVNSEDVGVIMPIASTDAEFNDYLQVTGLNE